MKVSLWRCAAAGLALIAAIGPSASARSISLNFSENSGNQGFAGGELIGPLKTDSATWNNTNGQPDLSSGSMSNLIDDGGLNTGASVRWNSTNPWYNGDGTSDDEHRMAVGYLDDGDGDPADGIGVSVTFTDIPYPQYRVYGLLASDQGGNTNYDTLDFTVNGVEVFGAAATAPAYNTITESMAQTGSFWSLADGTTRGNYWTIDSTGSTLTITGLPRNDAERGSLSAVIVKEIPEPMSLALMFAGAMLWTVGGRLRRRLL